MKTLKITLVATGALTIAWLLHIPHRVWPEHPQVADLFLGVIVCIVLQYTWPDTKSEPKK